MSVCKLKNRDIFAQFKKKISLEYLKFNDISYRIAYALTCAYVVVFYVTLYDPCMCVYLFL